MFLKADVSLFETRNHSLIVVIVVSENYTTAEVIDLSNGKTINQVELNKDLQRMPFTDAHIVNASAENFTYSIMTNKEIRTFQWDKEMWKHPAADNETFVFIGYDYGRQSVVVGSVGDDSVEVSSRPLNGAMKPFTFMFNPKTDILLKTWQYVLVIRLPPYAKATMIIAHRIEKREMLFNDIEREAGAGFQIKDLVLPSDLVILKSWKEYSVMVLEDLALKKVQIVSSLEVKRFCGKGAAAVKNTRESMDLELIRRQAAFICAIRTRMATKYTRLSLRRPSELSTVLRLS